MQATTASKTEAFLIFFEYNLRFFIDNHNLI